MDFLSLLAVAREIREALLGRRVAGAAAGAATFALRFAGGPSLLLDLTPGRPVLALTARADGSSREPLARAGAKALRGRALTDLAALEWARRLRLTFDAGAITLEISLLPRRPGALLADPARPVFSIPPDFQPEAPSAPKPPATPAELARLLDRFLASGEPLYRALRAALPPLGTALAREIASRATSPDPAVLFALLQDLLAKGGGPFAPRLLLEGEAVTGVSAIPLTAHPAGAQRPVGSMSQALLAWRDARRAAPPGEEGASLRRLLARAAARLERRVRALQEDLTRAAEADRWQRMGELLLANQRAIRRGASTVTLPDYAAGPEASLTIPLEPRLPIRANAEAYFKRAAKARRGLPLLRARLLETEGSLKRLAEAEARLRSGPLPPKEAEALRRDFAPRGRAGRLPPAPRRGVEGPAPRHFLSSEGRAILVGKSSQGNETLTFRLARAHDLWLHAQAVGGSHVLVRTEKAHREVPSRTLREAAVLAAYYSKARGQTKVSVDYTEARHVRKPKGGKVGEALITREKTIVVRPDPALVKALAERARAAEP